MTRKLTITVVLGAAALMLGAQSALAGNPDPPSMIQAREKALGRQFQLGDFAVNNTWSAALSGKTSMIQAREKALGRNFQLGDFAANNTWRGARSRPQTGSAEPVDFWNYESGGKVADSSPGVAPEDVATLFGPPASTDVAVATSDRDFEWPQLGIGLGIGMILALGLGFAMRLAHVRPFAH